MIDLHPSEPAPRRDMAVGKSTEAHGLILTQCHCILGELALDSCVS
jgi:hypothetical protein